MVFINPVQLDTRQAWENVIQRKSLLEENNFHCAWDDNVPYLLNGISYTKSDLLKMGFNLDDTYLDPTFLTAFSRNQLQFRLMIHKNPGNASHILAVPSRKVIEKDARIYSDLKNITGIDFHESRLKKYASFFQR